MLGQNVGAFEFVELAVDERAGLGGEDDDHDVQSRREIDDHAQIGPTGLVGGLVPYRCPIGVGSIVIVHRFQLRLQRLRDP